ncbi:aminotransferase class IV [Flavobacteriaceae bacterium S0825]|uniref:aminotransferase class IV n=1 Tax=Gaetbulibacter sp. S0825 TaxID=2720084 RepID=UPI001431657F|nr:aminotransferase class IV [Gaetbulibacter sp. S0825]MCK0109382.1 aminotransferase class IV [Flavobacteriaceae bacterium S0825]NIX65016.1 aminotransferase class IV [Gaetbulibacter sp. S0825]
MVNTNGNILNKANASLPVNNRGFNYGDAVFETIKVSHSKILFWEDHYFRLMASMRILRMEIPMSFTLEFLENEILKLVEHNNQLKVSVRVKLIVFRDSEGLYTPNTNEVSFLISSKTLQNDFYELNDNEYRVDLYKDHYISPSLLSTIKSNNRLINVIGGIYANENGLQNCLLLNTDKYVVEALNSNIFLVKGQIVKTPPLTDGCIKGVMRKQIIEIIKLIPEYTIEEASISPFELQKADELFLTNIISGIQPITNYRKKQFTIDFSKNLLAKLNVKVRLT